MLGEWEDHVVEARSMLEVTIIGLGRDGENWNDLCLVLQIPP
jgi:hypothetical protein